MQRARISRIVLRTIGVVVAVLVLGTAILVFAGLSDRLGRADIALVLGSKVELDGTPSPRLRARLDKTLELYRAGYFPAVIASGGTGREGFDEASVMRDYLVAHGIPSDRVMVDSRGTTTFMSARNTLAIVRQQKLGSVFVVSQYFHVPRTRLALRRFGISTVYSAHAHFFEARDVYSSFRELFGYLSYFFRHYDSESTPSA
jgi:vancomycin permeability regulator SanA